MCWAVPLTSFVWPSLGWGTRRSERIGQLGGPFRLTRNHKLHCQPARFAFLLTHPPNTKMASALRASAKKVPLFSRFYILIIIDDAS